MKYVVITSSGTFDFNMGQLAATPGSLACRDADGTAHAFKGNELVAVMRSDFAERYEAVLAELEQLKNRNGH
jgi:hypothetical protein